MNWASVRCGRDPVVPFRIMIFFIAVIATLNLVLGYFLAVYLGLAEPKRPTGVDAATADDAAEEIPDRAAPVAGSPVAATSTIEQRKVEKPAASFVDAQKIPAEPSASVDAASQPIAGNPEESGANDEADLLAGIESFRAQLAETNPASTDESETAAEVRDPPVDAEAKLPGAKPAPAEEPEPADTSQDAEDVLDDGPPEEVAIVATEVQPSAIAETAEEEAVPRDERAIESSEADDNASDLGGDAADEAEVADSPKQADAADAEIAEGLAAFRQQLATMKQDVGAEPAATS